MVLFISGPGSSHGYQNPLDQKNRDADATNGNLMNNIYTSIENIPESTFADHEYDEINQRKSLGYPGKPGSHLSKIF